jgi:hypothetical protein
VLAKTVMLLYCSVLYYTTVHVTMHATHPPNQLDYVTSGLLVLAKDGGTTVLYDYTIYYT